MLFKRAFSLIELMVVVAIIALLSMVAIPRFKRYIARAKRAEAYAMLNSIGTAERTYWNDHGRYSEKLTGPDGIGWKPEGYRGGGEQEKFYYTYGFSGAEGINYFTGKLVASASDLAKSHAGSEGFLAIAAGDIDGDGELDILSIDQDGTISIVKDDLQ